MCGIAGLVSKERIEIRNLKLMTDVISHRGPDGDGHWVSSNGIAGLGHRRLSIIDLSDAAAQPMLSADGRYAITFNGEIYNYIEIKESLQKKGYNFHSTSDTEVLLTSYIDKGPDCLQELDGMFAFAIWDEKEKTLFCARDRFGEKPFHYHINPGKQFAFASEMKSLWNIGITRKLNYKMLNRYFNDKYYLMNPYDLSETFYKDIYRLEPGHYLMVNEKMAVVKKKYWSLPFDKINTSISFEETTATFHELFFTSIKRRLRSDVPVGSSLSGGLDSSSIVCAINSINADKNIKQNTFSARFPGFEKDEGKYMDMVLEKIGIKGFSTYPDQDDFMEHLSDFMYHQEEPVASASQYVQWEVMKLAKQHNVTVLLDGQGADETLTGYEYYFHHFFKELYGTAQLDSEVAAYEQLHNRSFNKTGLLPITTTVAKPVSEGYLKKQLLSVRPLKKAWYQYKNKESFFTGDFLAEVWPDNESRYPQDPHTLNERLWNDTFLGGLECLLRYSDRNSMAFSREVRLPFLSHELVAFLFSLPSSFKISLGWSKYILRKSMEAYLPGQICWRKDKIGYEPPQRDWFAKPYMQQLLVSSQKTLEQEGVLNRNRKENDPSKNWQTVIVGELIK